MRTFLILALVVGGLVVAGAVHISQSGDTIQVSIDKQKVEAITDRVVREGEQVLKSARAPEPATPVSR